MAIKELTPEQVRTMTLEQKDKWWLDHVYRGDMPQLNLRSALTGMILGGILTTTNIYIGIKTGWTLGVGVTSVILSFAIFKLLSKMNNSVISFFLSLIVSLLVTSALALGLSFGLDPASDFLNSPNHWIVYALVFVGLAGLFYKRFSKLKLDREMTLLENNAMQSVATSAGYMTGPLISSMAAYMLVTNQVVPAWQTMLWIIAISTMGILFAFPLKKRFINDEQLPFPEGYAAGIVLDNLHDEEGKEGFFKAKILMGGAALSALVELMRSEKIMQAIRLPFHIPEYWDEFVYQYVTPQVLNTPLKDLTVRWETSIVLMGTGGLMSMKTAMSMLLGALLNYCVLAPYLIREGIIVGTGFKNITMWALWGGVAIMTTSSLYSFFSKPEALIKGFKGLIGKREPKKKDILEEIELPMWVFAVGIPIMTAIIVLMGHEFFGIEYWLGLVAVPLVFVFTIIAVNSTGLTSITPTGALAKLTQVTFAGLAPGNISTNLMTAGITSEVSGSASNLLMDIKPAYMLGGKPRHQAVGHFLGIIAGGLVSVPIFYYMFHGDISLFTSEKMPMPSATVWKAVAELLTKGLSALHPTARWAVGVGAVLGISLEYINQKTHGRFPISAMGLGLACVMRFTDSWAMALGTLIFWVCRQKMKNPDSTGYKVMVDNQETVAAGIIAGGSIIGIIIILLENAL